MVLEITPYDSFPSNHVLFRHLFDISDKAKLQKSIDSLFQYEVSKDDQVDVKQSDFTISSTALYTNIESPHFGLDTQSQEAQPAGLMST